MTEEVVKPRKPIMAKNGFAHAWQPHMNDLINANDSYEHFYFQDIQHLGDKYMTIKKVIYEIQEEHSPVLVLVLVLVPVPVQSLQT